MRVLVDLLTRSMRIHRPQKVGLVRVALKLAAIATVSMEISQATWSCVTVSRATNCFPSVHDAESR
jgi:hypothetical protein